MKGTHKHMETYLKRFDDYKVFLNQKRVNVCEPTRRHLYCVFTYISSLLIEKDICDCRNVPINRDCLY